jgi:hypothetical protein
VVEPVNVKEIPLSPDNQQFRIRWRTAYRMRIIWRDPVWCLDLLNSDESPLALRCLWLLG